MSSASAVMPLRLRVLRYRRHAGSPTLKAWVDLVLPDFGVQINRIALHRSTGGIWLAMPALQVRVGKSSVWQPVVEFTSGHFYRCFQDAALAAIRDYEDRILAKETSHDGPASR